MCNHTILFFCLTLLLLFSGSTVVAQDEPPAKTGTEQLESKPAEIDVPESPEVVSVVDVVDDYDIGERLQQILSSTNWYTNATIEVENGVVFLDGVTGDEKFRKWAGDLAKKTEDVVAVVNRIRVTEPELLDFSPAWIAIRDITRSSIRALPLIGISIILLTITWIVASGIQKLADVTLLKRVKTKLLREVGRKAIAIPVFIIGAFLILRITGLSQLAVTVLGGTGLFGLVIGIAFRDIAENFLASILLSMQNPFRYGDLIEVEGHLGYVQRVNTRGTLLMTLEGNHIQIPNSNIYKGTIVNYTANPNRRFSFVIGIGYDAPASAAQEAAMQVLQSHPAILNDPEPQVLVEQLASSTINLTVYAWVNAAEHSWVKVRSSVMRLTLKAFEGAGFSMPDDQREVVFPNGVPIREMSESSQAASLNITEHKSQTPQESSPQEAISNSAEGDFRSEASELQQQAKNSRDPDEAEADLLDQSLDSPEKIKESTQS